ncbi:hypothetical protein MFLO_05125 [Listeria floridensis FSL S10-1187]|uniref:UPF0398 protein MFLO_05125 n=1 Tax=Listeria floridensis FSL S10-1187 TaxID=1265817 RepID=A0ABN0RGF1_9LIST|nr:SLOG family protein [Listeria floridensis]EUJ32970.1 hypothetical protein MFLO_05125 [Listeria floridensis FSL S10-1187]
MKSLVLTGYKSFELGIFKRDAEEARYIKLALKKKLLSFLDLGLEWVIISGQLGTELWAGETVNELKAESFPIKLAVLEPFQGQAQNWNDTNKQWQEEVILSADYHAFITERPYENPGQFELRDRFMIDHTDGALLLYDLEREGSPRFFYERAKAMNEQNQYSLELIDFYELQEIVYEAETDF